MQSIADEQNRDRGSVPRIVLDRVLARELRRLIVDMITFFLSAGC